MKSNLFNSIVGTMLAVIFAVAVSQETYGQSAKGGSGGQLVGTWDSYVTITNCSNGAPIRTFASIGTFNHGGTSIGSTAGIPQAARTPEHGVWRHESGNRYVFRFKTFSFDSAGQPTGYSVITHTVEMDAGGDTYNSSGGVQVYTMNGNQIATGCSRAFSVRLTV